MTRTRFGAFALLGAACTSFGVAPVDLHGAEVLADRGNPDQKWSQPIDCERECYFSNTNSDLAGFVRIDDFVCTFTGDITEVTFWGGTYDLFTGAACPLDRNLRSFDIRIFEWIPDGQCNWSVGPLLCANTVPLGDAQIEPFCPGPFGENYFQFRVRLPEPCFQREGTRYGISIAGNLINPEDSCVFHWAIARQPRECPAYGFDRLTGEVFCDPDDQAFELWTEPVTDGRKWEQPINCDDQCMFSNLNSALSPWIRYDDFLCTFTGPITTIEFWGGMWDLSTFSSCSLDRNLRGVDITLYEWLPDGDCGWKFGNRLCNTFVPIQELQISPECPGPNGENYFKFTARLSDECRQEEGRRYAISVAGVLFNPDDPCVFHWALTADPRECIAFGIDRVTGEILCGPNDHAFALYTEAAPCRPDWNGDTVLDIFDVLAFLGDFSSGQPAADYNGDTVFDIFDILAFLGDFSTGC